MKTLYYIEIARSIDDNGKIIPAKKMKWYTPWVHKTAYEDIDTIEEYRYDLQGNLPQRVVRIRKAGWFKNLYIRCFHKTSPWDIIRKCED